MTARRFLLSAVVAAACKGDAAEPPEPETWSIAKLSHAVPLDDTAAVLVNGMDRRLVTAADLHREPFDGHQLAVRPRRGDDEPLFLTDVQAPSVALGIGPGQEMIQVERAFAAAPGLCGAILVWNGDALGKVPFAPTCDARPLAAGALVDPSRSPITVLVPPDGTVAVIAGGEQTTLVPGDLAKFLRPHVEARRELVVEIGYDDATSVGQVVGAWDQLRSIGVREVFVLPRSKLFAKPTR